MDAQTCHMLFSDTIIQIQLASEPALGEHLRNQLFFVGLLIVVYAVSVQLVSILKIGQWDPSSFAYMSETMLR